MKLQLFPQWWGDETAGKDTADGLTRRPSIAWIEAVSERKLEKIALKPPSRRRSMEKTNFVEIDS